MFDQVTIHVADRAASERFYRTVFAPLGIEPTHSDGELIEWDDGNNVEVVSHNR